MDQASNTSPLNESYKMLGVHINPVLDFREHRLAHITKDVRELADALAKRKLSPSCKALVTKQQLKPKYHATHLGVFNDRQLTEIDGILNKVLSQATCLLPNFPTEGVQRPPNELGLGLPSMRNMANQMGIEHLRLTMNKDTDRVFLAHSHILRILTQFNHCPSEALESNLLKLPTLRILRLASAIKDLELDNLPPLLHSNDIPASLRTASQAVDGARMKKRQTVQGTKTTIRW